jgi:dephospho-CoA kinase
LIEHAHQPVVVLEAVKLLESSLRGMCNSIWVTHAPERTQVERLVRRRGLSREQAIERMHVQPGQAGKVASADVAIHNAGSYEDLWQQVVEAWNRIPAAATSSPAPVATKPGLLHVQRGRPRDSKEIAELMTRLSRGHRTFAPQDVMAEFGDRAYLLLEKDGQAVGLAGWQVENLVARTTDLYLDAGVNAADALRALLSEVERASNDLQCEVSLAFPGPALADPEGVWKSLGYEQRSKDSLEAQAWRDAAGETLPDGGIMFFKRLRQERILRPI